MTDEPKIPLMVETVCVSALIVLCVVLVVMLSFGVYSSFVLVENNPSHGTVAYETREFWINLKEWWNR